MALTHLVVLVPGIAGSSLAAPDGRPVWGFDTATTVRSAMTAERLAIDKPVVAAGLLPTLGVLHWSVVPGYDRLTDRIKRALHLADGDLTVAGARAPRAAASVVEFPYDFRQDMATSAERLGHVIDSVRGDRRVIVMGHSMGGLVARWWWGVLGGHRVCEGLITVGTPHRGAPKAMDWLLNGARLGSGPVESVTRAVFSTGSEVLRGWPSVYDLLPRYPAIQTVEGQVYPHQIPDAPHWFTTRASEAYERHLVLEQACRAAAEESPASQFLAFYSSGHKTWSNAELVGGRVEVSKTDPAWIDTRGWEGGDGTVPAISAVPVDREVSVNERRWSGLHHHALASAPEVVQHLAQFEQPGLGAVRGAPGPQGPWIGLDYDEVIVADTPSSIWFELNGASDSTARMSATAVVKSPEGRGLELGVEPCGEDRWRVDLPGLGQGMYEFTIALDGGNQVDRVSASSALGVVEP